MFPVNQQCILLTLLFAFCAVTSSYAQSCLGGGLTLSTQQQIDNFPIDYPGCSVVLGSLTISESSPGNITDLSPLVQITSVGGRLLIFDNAALATLTGLDNISQVSSSVRISKCHNLSDLTGLESLTSINSFFSIDNNDNITQLTGLNASLTVGGRLEIESNPALQDLDGLSGLSRVGNTTLSVVDNPLLTSIAGLASVDISSIANLVIEENTSLAVCAEPLVCSYLTNLANPASIMGNGVGCRSREEVEDACLALPVEYSKFTGINTGKYVDLFWSVATQENNEGFEVLTSNNAQTWEIIGFVRATSEMDYQFRDESPSDGINFYRLRQIDLDGTASLSSIISFKISSVTSLVAYPNPASNVLHLKGSMINEETRIGLFDLLGRQVFKGWGSSDVRVDNIPPGTYLLICRSNGQTAVSRVQVVH